MDNIIKYMDPPGMGKPNRGAVFNIISRIYDIVKSDIKKVSNAFFPLLCDVEMLDKHSAALNIPKFPYEEENDYRARTATGAGFIENKGTRGQVIQYLNKLVPERYSLFEGPAMCFRIGYSRLGFAALGTGGFLNIKVRDLLPIEEEYIYTALDNILDPDIQIGIYQWPW